MKYICAFIGAMMMLCMNFSYANCGLGCPKVMIFAEAKSISDGNAQVKVMHAAYDTEMPYHDDEGRKHLCGVPKKYCLDPSKDNKKWLADSLSVESQNGIILDDHVIIIQHIITGKVLKLEKAKDYFKALYESKIDDFNVSLVSVEKKKNEPKVQYRIRFTKDKVELNPKEPDLDQISDINNKNTGDNADRWIVIQPSDPKLKIKSFRLHDLLQHRP